jgi:hypothetical protein
MTSTELKAAITADMAILKTIEVDIMPADDYYRATTRLYLHVFLKLYGIALLGLFLPLIWYWRYFSSWSEWQATWSALLWTSLLILGVMAFIMLMIGSALSQYILINYQLRPKLKTGDLIIAKIKLSGIIAYRIYAACVLIPSLFLPPGMVLYVAFGAFFVSGILTSTLVEMELDRIGISVLFTLVKNFFDQDKKTSDA